MRYVLAGILTLFIALLSGCSGWAYKIPTESMLPTLKVGSTVIVNPLEYSFNGVKRFDIVVFKAPLEMKQRHGFDTDVQYVMRVVGLPGEKIEIKNNRLFVNEKLIDETFEKIISENDPKRNFSIDKISENEFLMLGDNRPSSEDGRYWEKATIRQDAIGGKVIEIIEPDAQ